MESGKIQGTSVFCKKPYLFNSIKRNSDFVNKYLKNAGKLEMKGIELKRKREHTIICNRKERNNWENYI